MVESINDEAVRENTTFLAGFTIPEGMRASTDLKEVVEFAHVILMVVPTPFIASTLCEALLLRHVSHIHQSIPL